MAPTPQTRLFKKLNAVLSHRPAVVGTLTGGASLSDQLRAARTARVDAIEFRADTFPWSGESTAVANMAARGVISRIREAGRFPVLLTIRRAPEQSARPAGPALSNTRRAALFRALLPAVHGVDVEIAATALARDVTRAAHAKRVSVIHSFHDFGSPSTSSRLLALARASRRMGGDLFKAAITPRTEDDVVQAFRAAASWPVPRMTLIAMGAKGAVTRIAGYTFGSLLTYGSLGRATAPGQLSAAALRPLVNRLYPHAVPPGRPRRKKS